MISEREFIEMANKCYSAGHTMLKIEIKSVHYDVDKIKEKIAYLKDSQQNKFKNAMVNEFNKYRFNMEVTNIYFKK